MKLLSLIIFLPMIGSAILLVLPAQKRIPQKMVVILVTFITFALSLFLASGFDYSSPGTANAGGIQFAERLQWLPFFNIDYYVGIDGLNLPFILLTGFIFLIVGVLDMKSNNSLKGYWALLFLFQSFILGTYVSLDLFAYFMFWTASLVPIYFLIGFWGGGEKREGAATKMLMYNLTGSVLLIAGIIIIHELSVARSFDLFSIIQSGGIGFEAQKWLFLLLFLAIAIRIPVFPFHGWYTEVVGEAPLGINIVVSSLLAKTGIYALFRICSSLFPKAVDHFSYPISIFALAISLYAALAILSQQKYRMKLAYGSLSFSGFMVMGAVFFTTESIAGAMLHLFMHGVLICMLFVLIHYIELNHSGEKAVIVPGKIPLFSFFLWLSVFGAIGIPGFGSFISQYLIVMGVFSKYPVVAGLSLLVILIISGNMLVSFRKIFNGRKTEDKIAGGKDLSWHEVTVLTSCGALVIFLGGVPSVFLAIIDGSVKMLIAALQ